jgi:hypothetical protein
VYVCPLVTGEDRYVRRRAAVQRPLECWAGIEVPAGRRWAWSRNQDRADVVNRQRHLAGRSEERTTNAAVEVRARYKTLDVRKGNKGSDGEETKGIWSEATSGGLDGVV